MFLAYHAYIYLLLLLLPSSQRTAIQPRSRYFDGEYPLRDLRNVEWNISWVLLILRFAIAKCVCWCNDKQWYDCFLIYLITHNIPPVFAIKAWYSQRPLPCLHCFWKFWNRFWYQLKEMFLINHQDVRSYVSFLKKTLTHSKTDLNHAVTSGTLFDMYLQLHKFLLSNSEEILGYSGLKKSYFTWQKHGIIWKMSLTHKE